MRGTKSKEQSGSDTDDTVKRRYKASFVDIPEENPVNVRRNKF